MNYSSNDQRGWISGRWHWANKASCRRIYQLWSCVGRKLRSVWTKGIHLYDHKDEITMQTKVRIVVMSSWGGRWIELGMGEMPRPLPFFFFFDNLFTYLFFWGILGICPPSWWWACTNYFSILYTLQTLFLSLCLVFDIFLTDVWRNEVMGRGEGEVAPDTLSCPRPAFPRLCLVHQSQRGPVWSPLPPMLFLLLPIHMLYISVSLAVCHYCPHSRSFFSYFFFSNRHWFSMKTQYHRYAICLLCTVCTAELYAWRIRFLCP